MNLGKLAVAMMTMVAGCAPGPVSLTIQHVSLAYTPGEFAHAVADRDLLVVIVGDPFDSDPVELELAVTEAMKGSHWGPPTNFAILPDRSARPAYRVLLLFNPPASLNYLWLCAEEDAALPTSSGDDGVELFGAFCRDDYTLTAVKGRIAEAEDVHDPAFRELVGRVTGALFPADRDLYRARDTCIFQPNC